MRRNKIEQLLLAAKTYRESGRIAETLATLSQIVDNCPDEIKYKYLLAATFFEAEGYDDAEFYAFQVIEKDENAKESLALLGLIHAHEEKYEEAETFFKKALAIDPDFHNARFNLIKLYDERLSNDEELIKNGYYMCEHRDTDKELLSVKKRLAILFEWYTYVLAVMIRACARQKRYREVIELCENHIAFYDLCHKKTPSPSEHLSEYGNIYKAYYLLNDNEGLEAFKKSQKEIFPGYNVDWEKDNNFLENLAREGIF
jgi:tetratricopeptide (TPR) repeat protein